MSRHSSRARRQHSNSRGRSPATRRLNQDLDTRGECLQEEIQLLIDDKKFAVCDAKEFKTLLEILEADTLCDAQETAFAWIKLLYIMNTKGWAVAAKY